MARAEREEYDFVVIDTAPHADQGALRVARQADLILIPIRPSILDLDAAGASLDICALAKRPAVVVINAAPTRSRVTAEAVTAMSRLGAEVSPVIIRERVAFRHSLVDGHVAREFEPLGAADLEIGALWEQTCQRMNMPTSKRVNTQ